VVKGGRINHFMRSFGAKDRMAVTGGSSGRGEARDMVISEIPVSSHGSRAVNYEWLHSPGGPGVVDYSPWSWESLEMELLDDG
jgi:hypothetical protein